MKVLFTCNTESVIKWPSPQIKINFYAAILVLEKCGVTNRADSLELYNACILQLVLFFPPLKYLKIRDCRYSTVTAFGGTCSCNDEWVLFKLFQVHKNIYWGLSLYYECHALCAQGVRLVQLKNPWSHVRWRGNYSELDTKHWTPELRQTLNFDPTSAAMFDNGVFWIDYDSILRFYDVFYLNWNPGLFSYTYCIHQ